MKIMCKSLKGFKVLLYLELYFRIFIIIDYFRYWIYFNEYERIGLCIKLDDYRFRIGIFFIVIYKE